MSKYFRNFWRCCCNRNDDLYHPNYIDKIIYIPNDSYSHNDKYYDSEYYHILYQEWKNEFEEYSDCDELYSTFYSSIPKVTEV